MAKIDELKEKMSFLKFWLGVVIATFLAVSGWCINNYKSADFWILICAFILLVLLLFIVVFLCRLATKLFKQIRDN